MKAAIEVAVVLLPLSINRMFLNSSVKRGNSPEGKNQTLTLHLEKTMPIMAKISGKFPVSFLQATYLPCWRSQIYGAKRNTIGSCAVTWKFRSVKWTCEVRTGNRVESTTRLPTSWVVSLASQAVSPTFWSHSEMIISVNHERKSRRSLAKRLITCERNDSLAKRPVTVNSITIRSFPCSVCTAFSPPPARPYRGKGDCRQYFRVGLYELISVVQHDRNLEINL